MYAYHCIPCMQCISLYTSVYPCIPVYTHVYACTPVYIHVYQCIPVYTYVYPCIPVYTHVYQCIPMYTSVYPCIPVYTSVYHCIPMYLFPGLDGLPLPPPPTLGVKVLDSWKYQQSNKAARLQTTLGVGQINISC